MDRYDDVYAAKKYINKIANAKQRGIEFDLSINEFKKLTIRKACFYTGVVMTKPIGETSKLWSDLTIDRVDSSKGYIKGNVVACTRAANQLKGIWENPEFNLTGADALNIAKKSYELIRVEKGE